ncbi:probable protein phosphatase 2C 39 isoform X4 [Typha angustifolia]|uniref:probable protein phosphatase 2C 39 isoform X4 n=1 Tax=Typha angustifolia TaxID=59011 RepID=UPI003C2BA394
METSGIASRERQTAAPTSENAESYPWVHSLRRRTPSSLQMAGGPAGEDRVQVVCSEENGWLFCGIYDGFNGRDAADYLAGDSRGVLATTSFSGDSVQAIQLTETHTVDNEVEQKKLVSDHPDDPSVITYNRVKGKLKVTRAFGVVYLKERKFNDALMGILRVPNLCSPPYVSNHPHTLTHRVSGKDLFVVLGSDGLFDFFSNNEVVEIVHQFMEENPFGDPAKHLIEELLVRAAKDAGFSAEELMKIPTGIRREYHDDVTVIVIILGDKQQTSTASTSF